MIDFDIELPFSDNLYDEGVRGLGSNRPYKPEIVGTGSSDRPFFGYRNDSGELMGYGDEDILKKRVQQIKTDMES